MRTSLKRLDIVFHNIIFIFTDNLKKHITFHHSKNECYGYSRQNQRTTYC